MKNLLLAVSLYVVGGCSMVEVEHTHGELPELSVPKLKELCDKRARVKDKYGGIVFECQIKLK